MTLAIRVVEEHPEDAELYYSCHQSSASSEWPLASLMARIVKFKMQLVALVNHQKLGETFAETFAPGTHISSSHLFLHTRA
eukprot:1189547-Prorocentrum_minimum.AAC.2